MLDCICGCVKRFHVFVALAANSVCIFCIFCFSFFLDDFLFCYFIYVENERDISLSSCPVVLYQFRNFFRSKKENQTEIHERNGYR